MISEASASSASAQAGASFRDPAGILVLSEGRVLRIVNADGAEDLSAFFKSASGRRFIDSGRVVKTGILDESATRRLRCDPAFNRAYESVAASLVLEHERIPFVSYPYEWPPEMLHSAGELTIDLALQLLEDGLGLKDATPYNVLFRGPEPVFIDMLSFERRDAADPTWLPYAQFVRTFLLPLLANRHLGVGLDQILAVRRDGMEPEEMYRMLGPLKRLRPPFLSLVSLPKWLAARQDPDDMSLYRKRSEASAEKARFILETLLKGLRRVLNRTRPGAGRTSTWSDYMTANNNYSAAHFEAKHRFVERAISAYAPKRVLDVGCNTGHFSALAARAGARVVGIDYDPVVVGDVWRAARAEKLDILPLVVNLTRPSPGIGWRNRECASFLDRARGAFDCVLMLAVIHHMMVTERAPLAEVVEMAAELTTRLAVIEFIGPADSMFRRLVRGREHLHKDLCPEQFEAACARHFEVVERQHIEGTDRWLYLLNKRA